MFWDIRIQTVRLQFDHIRRAVYGESDTVWLSIKLISIKLIHRKNQTAFQVNKYRRDNFLCLCLREKYQDHISYFHCADGLTVIIFSISPGYIMSVKKWIWWLMCNYPVIYGVFYHISPCIIPTFLRFEARSACNITFVYVFWRC